MCGRTNKCTYFQKLKRKRKKLEIHLFVSEGAVVSGIMYEKKNVYAAILIDVKQRDGNEIFIVLLLVAFEYECIVSCLWRGCEELNQ